MKNALQKTKIFVKEHSEALVVAVVAAVAVSVQYRANKLHNEFLVEKGLFDEYYNVEV
jgi:menaquinone-dependent protoporphyrinogen IX oxidase